MKESIPSPTFFHTLDPLIAQRVLCFMHGHSTGADHGGRMPGDERRRGILQAAENIVYIPVDYDMIVT